MTIISYAQNFEDVMLWRALGHIEHGFYVDIGANDPLVDSVSLAFYEHGWRGVNVEPTPHYASLLRDKRSDEIVVQAAVGLSNQSILKFYEIPDTGISTADANIAQEHRERGFNINEITVPCVTLAAVFELCENKDVHWLKIDVEGFEKQVLQSWGSSKVRPWIVVIESTLPLTQIESHSEWESIIVGYGYSPIYYDGLNRYYVSEMHQELKSAFISPPNVFDGFTLNGTASATFHHLIKERFEQKIHDANAQLEQQKQVEKIEIARFMLLNEEVNNQITTLQQQTELEKVEQTLRYVEQERALKTQLQNEQQELRNLEHERAKREQLLTEQNSQVRQDIEELLRVFVQREQELGNQLLALQQQASEEKAELVNLSNEQERVLQLQYAEREQALQQQLQKGQIELRRLEQVRAEREQQFSNQLLALQQQTTLEKADLVDQFSKKEHALQSNIQAFQHAQQLQIEQHRFELAKYQDEHQHLIQTYSLLESQLNAEIVAEKTHTFQLQYMLAEVKQQLAIIHTSLTWRITAPLRTVAAFLIPKKNENAHFVKSEILSQEATLDTKSELYPVNTPLEITETIMSSSTQASKTNSPEIASTLDELLSHHDQAFIVCAYQTILGRAPDLEGNKYYLMRIRAGKAKIQILAQLKLSPEGKANKVNIHGLDNAIFRYRFLKVPFFGAVFRMLGWNDINGETQQRLSAFENTLYIFIEENNLRLNRIENSIATLNGLVARQTQFQSMVADTPTFIAPQSTVNTSESKVKSIGFTRLVPYEKDIYGQLKTAIAQKSTNKKA